MTISSLKQILTPAFISGLGGAAKGEAARATPGRKDDSATLDVSLRNGARNFSMGLQAINVGISYVQVSKQTHEQLIGIVDQLDLVLSRAAKGGLGSSSGKALIAEFQKLDRSFSDTIRDAKVRDNDILDPSALSEQLAQSGLDPERVRDLSGVFAKLTSLTTTSVDKEGGVVSARSLIPVSSFTNTVRRVVAELERGEQEGSETSDQELYGVTFRRIRDELKDTRNKLRQNIGALNQTLEVLGRNVQLTRATGLAMLELSQSIRGDESPEEIAERLRQQITASVPQALSQSGNLSSIMVAGLTLGKGGKSSQ